MSLKTKFQRTRYCCRNVLKLAIIPYDNKPKGSLTSHRLGYNDIWWITNCIQNGSYATISIFNGSKAFSEIFDNTKLFLKFFLTTIVFIWKSFMPVSLLEWILKDFEPEILYISAGFEQKLLNKLYVSDCWKLLSMVLVFQNIGQKPVVLSYNLLAYLLLSVISMNDESLLNI